MALTAVARYFGFSLLLLGAAMAAPAALAIFSRVPAAGNYAFSAAATIFTGGCLILLAGGAPRRIDLRSTMLLVFLWWTAAPLFGALPLWLDDWSFVDGYFEIVSALTTTGATLDRAAFAADRVDLFWRAALQWLGGLSSLAIAAAIFIRPAFVGADTLIPSFSTGERSSYAHAIGTAARSFVLVYAFITAVAITLLALNGASLVDAAILAMSTAASGGIVPHPEGLSAYPITLMLALAPFVVLSGVNFILLERTARGQPIVFHDLESAAYLALVLALGLGLWLLAGGGKLAEHLFNAASLFSTNGVTVGPPPGLVIALVTVIIGGSAVSTAGGLKILRWLVIMRRTQLEVRRLVLPSAVFGPHDAGNELGVWMHFLVFTFALAVLTAALAAGGHSFEAAAAGAVGALANAGPVIALTPDGAEGYQIFSDAPLRLLLAFAMIVGRLEGVAALMLINRAFWRG